MHPNQGFSPINLKGFWKNGPSGNSRFHSIHRDFRFGDTDKFHLFMSSGAFGWMSESEHLNYQPNPPETYGG